MLIKFHASGGIQMLHKTLETITTFNKEGGLLLRMLPKITLRNQHYYILLRHLMKMA